MVPRSWPRHRCGHFRSPSRNKGKIPRPEHHFDFKGPKRRSIWRLQSETWHATLMHVSRALSPPSTKGQHAICDGSSRYPWGGWFSLSVNQPTSSAGRSGSRSMFLWGLVPELLICAEPSQTLDPEGMRLIDLVSCNDSGKGQDYSRPWLLISPDRISRWFTTFPQAVPASATHTSHEFNVPVIW